MKPTHPISSRATAYSDNDAGLIAWLVFHAVALYSSVSYWFRFKRICAWHKPKPIRMGGNPFTRNVTHGICPACFAEQSAEILKHQ